MIFQAMDTDIRSLLFKNYTNSDLSELLQKIQKFKKFMQKGVAFFFSNLLL